MVVGLMLLVLIFLTALPFAAFHRRHTHEMAPTRVFSMLVAAPLMVVAWSGVLLAVRPKLGNHVLAWATSVLVLAVVGAITIIVVPIWYRREPGRNLVVLAAIFNLAILGAATFICWFTLAFF